MKVMIFFFSAVEKQLNSHQVQNWRRQSQGLSFKKAIALAKTFGVSIYWDMDAPRSREGYYQIRGGLKMCIARGVAFSPYCDILWMETKKPGFFFFTIYVSFSVIIKFSQLMLLILLNI